MLRLILIATLFALSALSAPPAMAAEQSSDRKSHYDNFGVAIYVVVNSTRRLADPQVFEQQFERVVNQVRFDKVYLEVYRNRQFATDAEITAVKRAFESRGIEVSGGVTPAAGGQGGQFGTFDYELAEDRAECREAVELAARHFDEVILDDFFFYTSKSDADIAARGERSWTEYRLDKMREVSQSLVLEPARAVNPDIRVIIKYPNWYEHFHGLGYDLELQPKMFDSIYTGTETRDPYLTDQLLQQYESYLIFRYFSNVRPDGGNLGGWVDTFSTQYIDRYAEQLWDTMFAKAPEITLFNWRPMSEMEAVAPGERGAWADRPTSFDWDEMVRSYRAKGTNDPGPGWGRAAGYSLEQVDGFLGALGRPVGLWSYRPPHASGEDFLHNYLGNVGIPIELSPTFPSQADVVLLTEGAAADPQIVERIHGQLVAGRKVVITSGLLRVLQGRGIERIAEIGHTGRSVAVRDFIDGYGAGSGTRLDDPAADSPAVAFPELHFYTNDSWPIIRAVAGARGFPIVLMSRYSRGILYVLNIPDNIADLYNLPQAVLTRIKTYIQGDFPVRIDAPALVSLFVYDNGTFIVQSFRDAPVNVSVSLAGTEPRLRNLLTTQPFNASMPATTPDDTRRSDPPRTIFPITIEPHSYQVFRIER